MGTKCRSSPAPAPHQPLPARTVNGSERKLKISCKSMGEELPRDASPCNCHCRGGAWRRSGLRGQGVKGRARTRMERQHLSPAFSRPNIWSITKPTGGDLPLFPESIHFLAWSCRHFLLTGVPASACAPQTLSPALLRTPSPRVPTSQREGSHVFTYQEPQALCDLFPQSHLLPSLCLSHTQPLVVA